MRDTSQDTCVQAQMHISCTFAALGWKSLLSSGYYMLSFLIIIHFQVEDLSEAIDVFANMRLACADKKSFLSILCAKFTVDSPILIARAFHLKPHAQSEAADMSCVLCSTELWGKTTTRLYSRLVFWSSQTSWPEPEPWFFRMPSMLCATA